MSGFRGVPVFCQTLWMENPMTCFILNTNKPHCPKNSFWAWKQYFLDECPKNKFTNLIRLLPYNPCMVNLPTIHVGAPWGLTSPYSVLTQLLRISHCLIHTIVPLTRVSSKSCRLNGGFLYPTSQENLAKLNFPGVGHPPFRLNQQTKNVPT